MYAAYAPYRPLRFFQSEEAALRWLKQTLHQIAADVEAGNIQWPDDLGSICVLRVTHTVNPDKPTQVLPYRYNHAR